jgi:hypothetical protein
MLSDLPGVVQKQMLSIYAALERLKMRILLLCENGNVNTNVSCEINIQKVSNRLFNLREATVLTRTVYNTVSVGSFPQLLLSHETVPLCPYLCAFVKATALSLLVRKYPKYSSSTNAQQDLSGMRLQPSYGV